jgi:phosphatidylglycerol:prolipoprotein diacylglycerol transferase
MWQTIVRIHPQELFKVWTHEDISRIGVGYLLVPWALAALWWGIGILRSAKTPAKEYLPAIAVWVGVGAIIVSLPFWIGEKVVPDGIPVYGYGTMLFVGVFVAAWRAAKRGSRVGVDPDVIWDMAMWVFFLGIVGARLFYVFQYHERVFGGKSGFDLVKAFVNLPDGGLVLYGGVLMAVACFFVVCRIRKLNPLRMADVVMPSFFIGLAFGRFGCFLNGCCYGDVCELPWAVNFAQGSVPFQAMVNRGLLDPAAATSMPLHPTQIYSSLNALVLAFLTASYFRVRHRDGSVFALGLIVYPLTRFVIEFLRSDELGQFETTLTISQWVSLGLFCLGLLFLAWLSKRPTTSHGVSSTNVGVASPAEPDWARKRKKIARG